MEKSLAFTLEFCLTLRELTGINQVWCADITYIRILNGFVYLASIIDIYSQKTVDYAIGKPYLLNLPLLL